MIARLRLADASAVFAASCRVYASSSAAFEFCMLKKPITPVIVSSAATSPSVEKIRVRIEKREKKAFMTRKSRKWVAAGSGDSRRYYGPASENLRRLKRCGDMPRFARRRRGCSAGNQWKFL
ncbi:hypothetical protein DO64_3871 [Burkholderia pseudomallei]|nr:hypothetical protein DO64_3871 [Burkholderia pseudomallei]